MSSEQARAQEQEFWRWEESNWVDESIDWREAETLSAGVDVGSVSSQAVVMADGKIYAYANMRTGSNSPDSARNVMNWALKDTGLELEKIHYKIGTGYGRELGHEVSRVPFERSGVMHSITIRYGRRPHPHPVAYRGEDFVPPPPGWRR